MMYANPIQMIRLSTRAITAGGIGKLPFTLTLPRD
jgi:hypothetical protein